MIKIIFCVIISFLSLSYSAQAIEELKWTLKLLQGITMSCEDLLDKEGNVRVTSIIDIDFKELELEE